MAQLAALEGHGGRRDERDPQPCCHQTQDLLRMIGLVSDPQGETDVPAERDHEIVIRGRLLAGEEDLRLVGKRVRGDAREPLQAVAVGKGDDQWLGEDGFDDEVPVVDGRIQESDLDPALAEGQDLTGHVELAELDVNVGMPLAKGPDDEGEDREIDPRGEAHHQTVHLATLRALRRLRGALDMEQDRLRLFEEDAARFRQLDPAAPGPIEERDPELRLELQDLLAERRLGHAKAQRRPAEMQLLRDGHEIPEMPKLHWSRIIRRTSQNATTQIFDVWPDEAHASRSAAYAMAPANIVARYAFTVLAVALASLLRGVLVPTLGEGVPFILYFPTVVLCAWFGGLWPGLLSAVLGGLVALYFFIPPYQAFTAHDPTAPAQLIVFLVASTLISLLADRLHRARRRAEAGEAREHEERERIRVTLTSVGEAVIVTDDRGRITLMNGVARSLTGWSDADAIGRPLPDVFTILDEESRRPVENPVARVLRDGQITGLANHTVLVSKDGSEIPIEDSAAPIKDVAGTLLGAVLVFRDISERRRAERERAMLLDQERAARAEVERLAARQRHLQSVTDTALSPRALDDLVPELLAHLRVAMASDTATILLLSEDGVHLTPFYSDGLPEDLQADIRIPLGHGVAGRIALSDRGLIVDDLTTVEVVRPILAERLKSLVGAPLKVGGRLLGILHAGAVEPRRFTDDDLGLLRLVADRAALAIERTRLDGAERVARVDADRHRAEAEATNRTKDQFLAVLSHELRQPLNTMLGWLSILRRQHVDPVQQERALDAIERNTRAQARMIDDLLDIARIEAGKVALDRRAVSLGPLIAETVESLQHEAKAKALTLRTELDPAARFVSADVDRLRQVFTNLLANAIKYTPPGGRVEIRLTAADGVVRITISDTGIGIEPDLLPHVFEPFRQGDGRSVAPQGGLGLGLAIVREIVEMHGGAVEAESDGRDRGATFIVTLPTIAG